MHPQPHKVLQTRKLRPQQISHALGRFRTQPRQQGSELLLSGTPTCDSYFNIQGALSTPSS